MEIDAPAAFDPQREYFQVSWEILRCCLVRTLLSYNARPAEQGGNELIPDLAAEMPSVSEDGLTWTFPLKPGLSYAPPLQDVEITAPDFIRAMERTACSECSLGGYPYHYSAVEGFDAFAAGEAESISGLEAPDDRTLIVSLTQPTGDLGFRFSLPATAPIPPNPSRPEARLGVAEGHDGQYGRFLVASGPYMFEGSEDLDFKVPPSEQTPATGYDPGRHLVLVRNPSWSRESDPIREANIDRFEFEIGTPADQIAQKIRAGDLDLGFATEPVEEIAIFRESEELRDQLHAFPGDAVSFMSFNLAEPPFDDIHVRKAVSLALDKEGLRRILGGEAAGDIAGHVIPDGIVGGALADFDPHATPGHRGDVTAAREEMALSPYDTDGDGRCDDRTCQEVFALTPESDPFPDQAAVVEGALEALGMSMELRTIDFGGLAPSCADPARHIAICFGMGWGKDYADGYAFGPGLFGSASLGPDGCCNTSLLGASPALLKEHGYRVTTVPSVDEQIQACIASAGEERVQCWAAFDRHLMEEIVPIVPYLFNSEIQITSDRVENYTFDQFASSVALDQIRLDTAP